MQRKRYVQMPIIGSSIDTLVLVMIGFVSGRLMFTAVSSIETYRLGS